MATSLLIGFTVFIVLVVSVESSRILLMPAMAGSHMLMYGSLGAALARRGHQVYLAKYDSINTPPQIQNRGIHFIQYPGHQPVHPFSTTEFELLAANMYKDGMLANSGYMGKVFAQMCSDLLSNERLYEELKKLDLDFAIVDNVLGLQAWYAIPHRLGIPYGNLNVLPPIDLFSHTLQTISITPTFPSYHSENPGFAHRLFQVFAFNFLAPIISRNNQDYALIDRYIAERPVRDHSELSASVKLWLVDKNPLFDYATQTAPNVVNLPGISTTLRGELPKDVQQFADDAHEGLIVVSYGGTFTATFPQDPLNRLLEGLNKLNQKAILRLKNKPSIKLRSGIKLVTWLPQNDLLAHPNTVLFITHGGIASINEGIYHGVPMLGIPNQREQEYNIHRFQELGYGLHLDRLTFTPDDLVSNVDILLCNDTFRSSVGRASNITRHLQPSDEKAVYWIEHVIQHGGDHLVPYSAKLAWYEVLMLDVMFVVLLACILLLLAVVKTLKVCRWLLPIVWRRLRMTLEREVPRVVKVTCPHCHGFLTASDDFKSFKLHSS